MRGTYRGYEIAAMPPPSSGGVLLIEMLNVLQRFDIASAGGAQQAEVDRLIALGAVRLDVGEDGAVVLADPDGNEFRVS